MSKKGIGALRGVIFCCHGGSCAKAGARGVEKALRLAARERGLKGEVKFIRTACTGLCKSAPVVIACANARGSQASSTCGPRWLLEVEPQDAPALLEEQLALSPSATPLQDEKPPKTKKPKKKKKD